MTRISGVVHTRNSADTVERTLRSLAWVDELVVFDMSSHDATIELARPLATRIERVPAAGRVDAIRNECCDRVSGEWVLVLDSDEYLSDDAPSAIPDVLRTLGERNDAIAIPRFNYIAGQVLRGSGWYPDHQPRLFRRGAVRWEDGIHRPPRVVTGKLAFLEPPGCVHIHHENYRDLRHFIAKQTAYALDDRYPPADEPFDFSDYIARAYEALATRADHQADGDLSEALALLMAWDQIVRGLVHWDSLEDRPPLHHLAALPVAGERVRWWRIRVRRWLGRHRSAYYVVRRIQERLRAWLGR